MFNHCGQGHIPVKMCLHIGTSITNNLCDKSALDTENLGHRGIFLDLDRKMGFLDVFLAGLKKRKSDFETLNRPEFNFMSLPH